MLYPEDKTNIYLLDNYVNVYLSSPNKERNYNEYLYGDYILKYLIYNDSVERNMNFRLSNPGYTNDWLNNPIITEYSVNGKKIFFEEKNKNIPEYNLNLFLIKGYNKIEVKIHATILDDLKEINYGHYSVLDFSSSKKWNISNFNMLDIEIHYCGDYLYIFNGGEEFQIIGDGKKQGAEFYIRNGYLHNLYNYFPDKLLRIHGEVLVPCECLTSDFCLFNTELTATDFMKLEFFLENSLNYYYKLLGAEQKIVNIITQLDKNQLRLLRNAYFANRGYIFKNHDLQTFFDSGIAYYPDENVKGNIIRPQDVNEDNYSEKAIDMHCGFMLDAILAAENGEDPAKAFEKGLYEYYKNSENLEYKP